LADRALLGTEARVRRIDGAERGGDFWVEVKGLEPSASTLRT
jgi:hypothetical protein